MSAIPAPVPLPSQLWDIVRPAISYPGQTVSKKYTPYRPNSYQAGAAWSGLNQLNWQVNAPQIYWSLADSYITLSLKLVDSQSANAPYATGAQIAPVYCPSFFNGGSFRIGGTQIEQLNSNHQRTAFVRQHLRRSGAQRVYGGATINMAVQPPAPEPNIASPTQYPPANAGPNSLNVNPVLVSTIASTSPALNNNIFSTAYVNPDFSAFFYQSQRLTDNGRIWQVKLPLHEILTTINEDTPVVQGNTIDLELLLAKVATLVYAQAGVNVADFLLMDAVLWLCSVTPSVEVAATLTQLQAEGAQSQIQSMLMASLPFPSISTQAFSTTTTVNVSNPQWLVFSFTPANAGTTQSACMPQCSIPPYAANTALGFPFSSFQVTLNGDNIPEPQFGTYALADMQRAYEFYLQCCEETDLMGGGPPVSLEQYQRNFFFLCLPAYNRTQAVAGKGIASGSSLNVTAQLQGTPSAAWTMYLTYQGVQTAVFSATTGGISVINVS